MDSRCDELLYSSSQKAVYPLEKSAWQPGERPKFRAASCHRRSIMNTFSSCSGSHRGSIDGKDDPLRRLACTTYSDHRKESLSPQCLAPWLASPTPSRGQREVGKRSSKVIQTTLRDTEWVSNWIYERTCKRQDGESSHIRGTALVLQNGRSHELLQLLLTGLPKPVTGWGGADSTLRLWTSNHHFFRPIPLQFKAYFALHPSGIFHLSHILALRLPRLLHRIPLLSRKSDIGLRLRPLSRAPGTRARTGPASIFRFSCFVLMI